MAELYLVAHKVRGEPAFDVALRIDCPECHGATMHDLDTCSECNSAGYWWIIPTSGHRAYPYWWDELNSDWLGHAIDMPPDLPDHYISRAAPKETLDISELLAGLPQGPRKNYKRR